MARRRAARAYLGNETAARHAARLRAHGQCVITDVAEAALLHELERESLERVRRADQLSRVQAEAHKSFWVRLLEQDTRDGAFDPGYVFVRFALQAGIVSVLAEYLGELPRLMDVLLTYSLPTEQALSYSQLWHRDHDDVRTLKVFVYLTDVLEAGDGPFTFLVGPESDRVGFTLRSHLPDEDFFKRARRGGVAEVRAPRLSVFVCETSRCYHMGSRVHPGHARLMYTATFISSPNVYPEGRPRFRSSGSLREAERLLLGLPE